MALDSRVILCGSFLVFIDFIVIKTLILRFLCIGLGLIILKPLVDDISFLKLSLKLGNLSGKGRFGLRKCLLFLFF
jgi:hypothetical protein